MKYIGNKRTKELHVENCSRTRTIKNREVFFSIEDALKKGYDGCHYCLPQYNNNPGFYKKFIINYKPKKRVYKSKKVVESIGTEFVPVREHSLIEQRFSFAKSTKISDPSLRKNVPVLTGSNLYIDENSEPYRIDCKCDDFTIFSYSIVFSVEGFSAQKDICTLVQGPQQMPLSLYLKYCGNGFYPLASIETPNEVIQIDSKTTIIDKNKWYKLTVIYTGSGKEFALILNDSDCIARKVLKNPITAVNNASNFFVLGKSLDKPMSSFKGFVSDFEYGDEIQEVSLEAIKVAIEHGLGEFDVKYYDLANKLGDFIEEGKVSNGLYRKYRNGTLFWCNSIGTYAIFDAVLDRYNQLSGPQGILGFPMSDEKTINNNGVSVQAFENGAIYRTPYNVEGTAHELLGKALAKYLMIGEDSNTEIPYNIGTPYKPAEELKNGFYRVPFVKVVGTTRSYSEIYYPQKTNADSDAVVMPSGDIRNFYEKSLKNKVSPYGYPTSDEIILYTYASCEKEYRYSKMSFQNGTIYCVTCERGSKDIQPSVVFLNSEFDKAFNDEGGYENLGMPIYSDPEGIYVDCMNGTLVKPKIKIDTNDGRSIFLIQEITLHITKAESGPIDDGKDWRTLWTSDDRQAELTYHMTFKTSDIKEKLSGCSDQPETYYRTKTKNIDFKKWNWHGKVKGSSKIYFKLRYEDWDGTNENEQLGYIERTLEAKNLWGIKSVYADGEEVYLSGNYRAPLDYSPDGSTTRFCREETVMTSYNIRGNYKPYIINKDTFRSKCWWPFDNFSNYKKEEKKDDGTIIQEKDLRPSRNFVAHVFRGMDYINENSTWAKIVHPFDSIFYELLAKDCGTTGNCFGMSLTAMQNLLEDSYSFPPPFTQYRNLDKNGIEQIRPVLNDEIYSLGNNEGLRDEIMSKQLYQLGAASALYTLEVFGNHLLRSPKIVLQIVKDEIEKYGFALVNFVHDTNKGHTVLAYKVEKLSDSETKIFIADPNFPSSVSVNVNGQELCDDICYIIVNSLSDSFQYWCPIYDKDEKKDKIGPHADYKTKALNHALASYMCCPPYSMYKTQPICPTNFMLTMLCSAIINSVTMIIFGGDVECSKVSIDGKVVENDASLIPIPVLSSDANTKFYILKSAAKSIEFKLLGKGNGEFTQSIESKNTCVTVKSTLNDKKEGVISIDGLSTEQPGIRYTSNNLPTKAVLSCRSLHRKTGRTLTHEVEMMAGNGNESKIMIDSVANRIAVSQGRFSEAIKLTRKHHEDKQIKVEKVSLKPNQQNEMIVLSSSKESLLKSVILERKDVSTGKRISKTLGHFK